MSPLRPTYQGSPLTHRSRYWSKALLASTSSFLRRAEGMAPLFRGSYLLLHGDLQGRGEGHRDWFRETGRGRGPSAPSFCGVQRRARDPQALATDVAFFLEFGEQGLRLSDLGGRQAQLSLAVCFRTCLDFSEPPFLVCKGGALYPQVCFEEQRRKVHQPPETRTQ